MADWNLPILTTLYTSILTILKDRDFDAISLCYNGTPTNPQLGMIQYLRASDKFQEWNGTAWVDKLISITGGGTGAATAANARTNLGLGTTATQNSNNVNITGGSISGVPLNAPSLTGLVPTASLGSGSANSGTWLRGDQSWQPIPAGTPSGAIIMYGGAAAPTDWLLCNGAAVSRATYAALFAAISTTYGAGDLSTTFNLPDLRQRFPLGKAASGTGATLGATGGAIDHTHTGAAHTHSISADGAHTHTGPNHTHTFSGSGTVTAGGYMSIYQSNDSFAGAGSPVSVSGTTDAAGTGNTSSDGSHNHTGITGSTTPGAGGSNNPPYQVVNYIIKT